MTGDLPGGLAAPGVPGRGLAGQVDGPKAPSKNSARSGVKAVKVELLGT